MYDKFVVYKVPEKGKGGVKPVARAFVLVPENDPAAIDALTAYVEHADVQGTKLGHDLFKWIQRIEEGVLHVPDRESEDASESDSPAEDGGAGGEGAAEERENRVEGVEAGHGDGEAQVVGAGHPVGAEGADAGGNVASEADRPEARQATAG